MPVRAAVGGKAREHQAQAVEELGAGAESAPYPGNTRTLPKGKGRGDMEDLVDVSGRRAGHAPPRIGRERLEVAPRSLRVEDAERQG